VLDCPYISALAMRPDGTCTAAAAKEEIVIWTFSAERPFEVLKTPVALS